MSQWVRLWEDMPNDPKWRVVARRSGRPVSEVLAVFVHMLTNAANPDTRGLLTAWSDEDVAIAIDADTEHVSAIREAMQGKTLDGEHLTGWDKRQPKREDTSTERVKAWRERNKEKQNAGERDVTHVERTETVCNATKPPEEKREDKKEVICPKPKGVRTRNEYPPDFLEFWNAYPTDPNMGKQEAFQEWQKLTEDERRLATKSCPSFVRHCKADPTYRPIHACRYLAKRRFEGHVDLPPSKDETRVDFGGGYVWPETTVRAAVDRWRGDPTTWPADHIGPPPGKPGCRVPGHLLTRAA